MNKSNKGITLIALIITIMILLLLSGVAISVLVNNKNITGNAKETSIKAKTSQIQELLDTMAGDLQYEKTIHMNTAPLTLEDYVTELSKQGKIQEELTDRTDPNNIIIATMDGDTYIIKMLESRRVVVEYIGTKENLRPIITYTVNTNQPAYKVKLKIKVRETKNGIAEIKMPDGTVKVYQDAPKEVIEEIEIIANGTYTITVKTAKSKTETQRDIYIRNIVEEGSIIMNAKPAEPRNSGVTTIQCMKETGKVQATINWGKTSLTNMDKYQYKINDEEWKIANTNEQVIEIEENCEIYARFYDGMQIGTKTAYKKIDNIDNEPPNDFTPQITRTANSITIKASTQDKGSPGENDLNIGILCYQYSKDGGINWQPDIPQSTMNNTEYTFNGLNQGQTYQIVVKAIDLAGNITAVSQEVKTNVLTLASVAKTNQYVQYPMQNNITYVGSNTNIWVVLTNTNGTILIAPYGATTSSYRGSNRSNLMTVLNNACNNTFIDTRYAIDCRPMKYNDMTAMGLRNKYL